MSEGRKFDGGKSPVVQGCLHYFPQALLAVGKVSEYGANKYSVPYSDKNWGRLNNAFNRYTDGLGRHLLLEGLDQWDEESKLLHAAHAAWNALARLELLLQDGASLEAPPSVVPPAVEDDGIPF